MFVQAHGVTEWVTKHDIGNKCYIADQYQEVRVAERVYGYVQNLHAKNQLQDLITVDLLTTAL